MAILKWLYLNGIWTESHEPGSIFVAKSEDYL